MFQFFYFELDGVMHTIKTDTIEVAQQRLVDSGITAPILEEFQHKDGDYLTHGCEGQLDPGMPTPIAGTVDMLAKHKKLNEIIPNFYPSNEVVMIGKLTVARSSVPGTDSQQ
jgi:hypothetical protein